MDLFELAAKLSLDAQGFTEGIASAKSQATSLGDTLSGALGAVVDIAEAVGGAIAGAVSSTAAYGDSIDKASQKLGVSASFYQEWEAVLQHSGTSMSSMTTTFKTLAKASQDASDDQQEAFAKLGLSLEDVASMSSEELFTAVISSLQDMGESTERTALATTLLGKGAMEMGALLNTSAEDTQKMIDTVNELGGVMSDEAVKGAAAYTDSLQDMKTAFSGFGKSLVGNFLPEISQAMNGITQIMSGDFSGGFETLKQSFSGIGETLTGMISTAIPAIKEFVGGLISELPGFITGVIPQITGVMQSISNQIMEYMPVVIETIMSMLPTLFEALPQIMQDKMQNLSELIVMIGEMAAEYVPQLIETVSTGISTALPALIETLVTMFTTLMPTLVNTVVTTLPTIIESLVSGISQIIPALVSAFGSAAPQVASSVGEMAQSAFTSLSGKVVEWAGVIGEAVTQLAETIYNKLPASMQGALTEFGSFCKEAWAGMQEMFTSLWDALQAIWEHMTAYLSTIWTIWQPILVGLKNAFVAYLEHLWNRIKITVMTLIDIFRDIFDVIAGLTKTLTGILTGDFGEAAEGIEQAFNGMIAFFSDIWEGVKAIFANAKDWFSDVGKQMWEGLKGGIESAISGVKDWAGNVVDSVKGAFGINSPSKVFRQLGSYVSQGLMIGMNSGMDSFLDDYSGKITESVNGIYGEVKYSASAIGRSTADSISSSFMSASDNGNATINLTLDSKVLATALYNPLSNVVTQKGVAIGATN